jgi:hypothetical protein
MDHRVKGGMISLKWGTLKRAVAGEGNGSSFRKPCVLGNGELSNMTLV